MKTLYRTKCGHFIQHIGKGFTAILLIALIAGCASTNQLREAQDSFNQAATTENSLRFDAKASDAVAGLLSVRSGYASALISLEKLENSKDKAQLKSDGLWGAALTLKALTQWRLGQFDKAIATAALAKQDAGQQIYPRDLAVISALPGLVKTDQAYEKILQARAGRATPEAEALLREVRDLLTGPNGAVANIQEARQLVDKLHPVHIYLIQAQLAAFHNLQEAYTRLIADTAHIPDGDPAIDNANAQLKELKKSLEKEMPGAAGDGIVEYWKLLCGLNEP